MDLSLTCTVHESDGMHRDDIAQSLLASLVKIVGNLPNYCPHVVVRECAY